MRCTCRRHGPTTGGLTRETLSEQARRPASCARSTPEGTAQTQSARGRTSCVVARKTAADKPSAVVGGIFGQLEQELVTANRNNEAMAQGN